MEKELTPLQIEIIQGALLGDGCLNIHKNGINANFIYTSKSRQHVEFIGSFLEDYDDSVKNIYRYEYYDERTDKTYVRFSFKTKVHQELTEIYKKWYKKEKVIPEDLVITPMVALIWYIGDGGISHGNRTENIKLSTHCFSKESQEKILLPQLIKFEPKLMKADMNSEGHQQYFIYIPHRKEKEFLEYIGPCPFEDYQYKWNYKEYKNAIPKNHTSLEKEFCKLYLEGKTYYQIAQIYNIEPNAVKYYLQKNKIYHAPSKYKNTILQIKENKIVNIFISIKDASEKTGINSTGISMVASGKRKSSGGFQWKKMTEYSEEEQNNIINNFKEFFKE